MTKYTLEKSQRAIKRVLKEKMLYADLRAELVDALRYIETELQRIKSNEMA